MRGLLLRRAAIFVTLAVLGTVLASLLSEEHRGPGPRPRLPVVAVPAGTEFGGTGGVPGVSLVGAEGVVISDVRTLELDDGTKVPFRAMLLRAASERALPSPEEGVHALALEEPDLQLVPVPGDRAEWEASATAPPLHLRAPRGTLLRGPGEALLLLMEGGVRVEMEREGVPWTVEAEGAVADLRSRRITAPGAVAVTSTDLEAEGAGLEAEDGGSRVLLSGGARGTVRRSTGARIGGLAGDGGLRFACTGPFLMERIAIPPPLPGAQRGGGPLQRFRITLREAASLEQGDGRLEAGVITIDLDRSPEGEGPFRVNTLQAEGGARLAGGREGRTFEARAGTLVARPLKTGVTDVRLEGDPVLLVRDEREGRTRTLRASSAGPAAMMLPRGEGPVSGLFRGSAAAVLLEEAPGTPPVRRELTARMLRVEAFRGADGGPALVREILAEGEARLQEEDRTARARAISWAPTEDSGSRVVLRESVAVHWPAAGLLDPVSAVAGGNAGSAGKGSLLLASPGEAVLLLPPGGAERGASVSITGGAVIRRIVGEQEVYRLNGGRVEADLHPDNRGIARLHATRTVRLEGREENAGGRRYDLRGDSLLVTGRAGEREPLTALLEGSSTEMRATAAFTDDEGRPFRLTSDAIRFDRRTGAFRADGDVRGTGVLPEKAGGSPTAGGRAAISCPSLSGILVAGAGKGSSRLRTLSAAGPLLVETETDFASGDRLRWDASEGVLLLEGEPARVSARSGPGVLELEDRCEAPTLRLTLAAGRLVEARAERGGLFVRHRVPVPLEGKQAAPPERLQARCTGLLLYTPGETRMQGEVALSRARRTPDGAFEEKDRLEGADALRVLHPVDAGSGTGRLASAEALSPAGKIRLTSAEGSWKASGVTGATLDGATDTVTLDASMDRPRFRLEGRGTESAFRRVVYDYAKGIFTEQVGATIGDGR